MATQPNAFRRQTRGFKGLAPFVLAAILGSSSVTDATAAVPAAVPPVTMNLVIAATTDTHGRVRGWDYYTNGPDATHGLSRVATIVDSIRRANPGRVLMVDAGDLLQGNPLMYVAAKVARQTVHPTIAAMNAIGYDAAVVGNHEFNYGVPFLAATIKGARFPFLAGNVRTASGAPRFPTTTTVIRDGVRVAIVGATTPGAQVWDAENLRAAGLHTVDIVPVVSAAVASARRGGADVVVVVLHSGLSGESSYDTATTKTAAEEVSARVAKEVRGIDVLVFGHSHRELVDSTINGTLVIQPKNWAATVGIATLSMEKRGAKWAVVSHRGSSVSVANHAEAPRVLAATDAAHRATIKWVTTPIGKTNVAWRSDSARVKDTPIVDFMLEVMRRETKADLATTAAFSLNARLDSGAVTLSALSLLYPYDNTLRAVRISGAQLKAFIEYSSLYFRTINADGSAPTAGAVDLGVCGYNYDIVAGADYTIDLRKPPGQRVTKLAVHGKPVTEGDHFTMAVNNYRQSGGGGFTMLAGAPVVFQKDVDIRQLLIEEVKRVGTLRPGDYFTQNWTLEPASVVGVAYNELNRAARNDTPCSAPKPLPATPMPGASSRAASEPAVSLPTAQPQPGRTLRLITTSDFHAALEARKDDKGRWRGGAVALEATLDKARKECRGQCTSITIDGGDLFTGAPASDWDSGKPTVAVYKRLGISAGALGNHEFDFGQDTLRQRLAMLNYRVLAANVLGTDGKVPNWLRADTIVVRDGLRIGIVGAAAEFTPSSTKRRNVKGLQFLAPAPIVSERIKALRAQNVDAVIVTIHEGGRCTSGQSEGCTGTGMDFVKALTEKPDAVVLAHAHTNVVLNLNGIPAVQVTSNGRAIGVVDIPLSARNATTVSVRDVFADSLAEIDAITDTIVKNAVSRVAPRMARPVATVKEFLSRKGEQYPLGNLMADAARVMANADFGAWNNGGIRADLPAGPLNYGGVHELSPFGNVLAKLGIRGSNMGAILENIVSGRNPDTHISGLLMTYDSTKTPGQRIVSLTLSDGRALDPNRVYSLAINDYMLDDPGFTKPAVVVSTEVLPIVDNDALAEYFRRLPQPVVAPAEVRVRNVAAPRQP